MHAEPIRRSVGLEVAWSLSGVPSSLESEPHQGTMLTALANDGAVMGVQEPVVRKEVREAGISGDLVEWSNRLRLETLYSREYFLDIEPCAS